jgi:hypothetical protein
MKRTHTPKLGANKVNDMLPKYYFDYRKARPNRFIERIDKNRRVVILDADISEVFTTEESVNKILRALITTMPKTAMAKAFRRSSKNVRN